MIYRFFFILIIFSSTNLSAQSGAPSAEAIDSVLKHKPVNGKGFIQYHREAIFSGEDPAQYIGKNLGTNNLTQFCISGKIDQIGNDYRFYFNKQMSEVIPSLIKQGYLADHKDVVEAYMFSIEGNHSYGSFDISNEKTGVHGRFLFRYNLSSQSITDLLIAKWGSDDYSKAYLVLGNMDRVKNYKRPNISNMKMLFGGSIVEILCLFSAFLFSLIVLHGIFLNKNANFGSVLCQYQVIIGSIGAYGVCFAISFFGSMPFSNDLRSAPVYFDSLIVLLTKLFALAAILFVILYIKLKPRKYIKFWMYSNLIVIPLATFGILQSIIKLVFNR